MRDVPNLQRALIAHLLADARIVDLVGRRVGKQTPDTLTDPWLRVTVLNAHPSPRPPRRIDALVQIDCYAGANENTTPGDAESLGHHVQHAFAMLPNTPLPELVVVSQAHVGFRRMDDGTISPPRERLIVTEHLVVRP